MANETVFERSVLVQNAGDASIQIIPDTTSRIVFSNLAGSSGSISFDDENNELALFTGEDGVLFIASSGVTIDGDLNVTGTTTTVGSTNLALADNVIVLNDGEAGPGISNSVSGIVIDRGYTSVTDYDPIFNLIAGTGDLTFADTAGVAPYLISRTIGDWSADGVVNGSIIRISGSSLNDGDYTVVSVDTPLQITVTETVNPDGPETASAYLTGIGDLTFDGTGPYLITRTTGDWAVDGAVPGTIVRIFGSNLNDGEYTVVSVDTSLQITVTESLK
jgi:hypothetical protein